MMEVENMSSSITKEDDDDLELPGFRFHPTDEELVGFYLRRKVEKRPLRLDLINQVDIYKFDPWDLPIKAKSAGDKEWYFFCRRGRKYKNSVRPNRVTRSGFWKATGIDRPIYSSGRECIGLKKSLVYYRGSAGKGTKTDWMMHEFRLPAAHDKSTKHIDAKPINQEAEVWTLCRVLKRNAPYRKCVPDWREMAGAKRSNGGSCSETCSVESSDGNTGYISFAAAPVAPVQVMKQSGERFGNIKNDEDEMLVSEVNPLTMHGDINEFIRLQLHADWDDLRSAVDCAAANPNFYSHHYS